MLFVAILLLFIVYKFGIKNSIEAISSYKQAQKQLAELSDAPLEINNLKQKLTKFDNSVNFLFNDSVSIQELMLDQIASYCNQNQILIKQFPKSETIEKGNYILETNYLVLEGSFQKLLLLLYNIEQKYRFGKISSARFYKELNQKTKAEELNVEIFIQNIKENEL